MDDLTRWNDISGIVYNSLGILILVAGYFARKRIGRLIQRMIQGLFNALGSLFYTITEWWDSWGRRVTIVLVIVAFLSVGIFYIATKVNPIGAPFITSHALAQTYSTRTPGLGCDKGAGQWKEDNQLLLTCLTNRVGLTYTGDGSDFYELFFGGSDGTHSRFTNSYSVHVEVTFPDNSDAYVGVGVHGIANRATCGQMGWIQPNDATWILYRYRPDGSVDTTLDTGLVTATASTYTLDVAVRGTLITLLINGIFATRLTDSTFQTTSYVCIGMGGSQNDTVTISNFEFTPNS